MNRYVAAAAAALALMLVAAAFIFLFAPTDALQGPVQRIFYGLAPRLREALSGSGHAAG